jgi:hypothetical protein
MDHMQVVIMGLHYVDILQNLDLEESPAVPDKWVLPNHFLQVLV